MFTLSPKDGEGLETPFSGNDHCSQMNLCTDLILHDFFSIKKPMILVNVQGVT